MNVPNLRLFLPSHLSQHAEEIIAKNIDYLENLKIPAKVIREKEYLIISEH